MKRTTHRPLFGIVAVSAALLISSCSSSGSDSKDDEKTTTTEKVTTTVAEDETTTTEAEGESDPEAQARAESVDLTVSDFPDGWEATPAEESDEESPLNQCDPALGDRSVQLGRHATDDFSVGSFDTGDGTQFTARTVVFEDEAAAEAAVAPFSDPEVITCIDEGLKEAIGSSGDVTVEGTLQPETSEFDVDEQTGLSATYTVTGADGTTFDLNFGILVLRTGDVATNILIQTVDPALDATALPVMTLVELLNAA